VGGIMTKTLKIIMIDNNIIEIQGYKYDGAYLKDQLEDVLQFLLIKVPTGDVLVSKDKISYMEIK